MKRILGYVILYSIVILISASAACVGVLASIIKEKHPDYFTLNVFEMILVFLVAILVSTWLHELVHMLAFKGNGLGIRMFYVFPILFVREKNNIRIRFAINAQVGVGGVVLNRLPVIKNEDEFKTVNRKISNSLLAAPLFSAIVGLLSLLLAICGASKIQPDFRSLFFFFFSAMFLCAVYINVTSLLSLGSLVGDYAGARKFRKNKEYALIQIYNDFLLQERELKEQFRKKERWLFDEMATYMYENKSEGVLTSGKLLLADAILYEALLVPDQVFCDKVSEVANYVDNHIEEYEKWLQFGAYTMFFCHLMMFMSAQGRRERAIELWEKYGEKIRETKEGKYSKAQVALFLYNVPSELLLSNETISISSLDSLFGKVDGYYEDELLLNKRAMEK